MTFAGIEIDAIYAVMIVCILVVAITLVGPVPRHAHGASLLPHARTVASA